MKKLLGWRQVRQIQNLNFDPQVYAQSLIKQGLSEQQAQGLVS